MKLICTIKLMLNHTNCKARIKSHKQPHSEELQTKEHKQIKRKESKIRMESIVEVETKLYG